MDGREAVPYLAPVANRIDRLYDVLVIGAGINGAAVARDCAMRRLSVLLVEKDDVGCGSSSLHAGLLQSRLRYFESLANPSKEAVQELAVLERIAPNLLHRIPIVLPSLQSERRSYLERLETFAEAYDRLSALKGGLPHRRLDGAALRRLEPSFGPDIRGAITVDEWRIDAHRLVLLNVKSAVAHGAELLFGATVERILAEGGKVLGVTARRGGSPPLLLRANTVVNAAGPWIPFLEADGVGRVGFRATKSVYLVFDRRVSSVGAYCPTGNEGRGIAVLPFGDRSVIGAAETEFYGHPDQLDIFSDEIGTLLYSARRYLPDLARHRAIRAFAGVRPRISPRTSDATAVLIDHEKQGAAGYFTYYGGTLAAYRHGAETVTNAIARKVRTKERCRTHLEALPGCSAEIPWEDEARRTGLSPRAVRKLLYRHGYDGLEILEDATRDPALARTLCECEQVLAAEVDFCVRREWARTLPAVARRTGLGMGTCAGCRCALATARLMGGILGWDLDTTQAEAARFIRRRDRDAAPALYGEQARQAEYARWVDPTLGGEDD